jgi:hypothetical protein
MTSFLNNVFIATQTSRAIGRCECVVNIQCFGDSLFRRLKKEMESVSVTMGTDLAVARPIVREDVIAYNSYY